MLRNTYSWREKFQRCVANKEFQRLSTRIHIDISVCRNVVNRCNPKEAVFSSVWAVVFFPNTSSRFKALFSFSLPTIHKNTGFRLRNAVEIHRHMRLCHAIWVALSCHTGCHEVGLKVIVFVYTCNVCYAVLSFLLNWPWIYLHFSVVSILNAVTAAPH